MEVPLTKHFKEGRLHSSIAKSTRQSTISPDGKLGPPLPIHNSFLGIKKRREPNSQYITRYFGENKIVPMNLHEIVHLSSTISNLALVESFGSYLLMLGYISQVELKPAGDRTWPVCLRKFEFTDQTYDHSVGMHFYELDYKFPLIEKGVVYRVIGKPRVINYTGDLKKKFVCFQIRKASKEELARWNSRV